MKYLKSQCIGKFLSVKGTVIRVSTIKPILIEMKFLCTKCGFETTQHMIEGKFEAPVCCSQVPAWFLFSTPLSGALRSELAAALFSITF
jgi:DNA replicative helicase MCM subunit Mcm2 (Cdc46/Mcm family)